MKNELKNERKVDEKTGINIPNVKKVKNNKTWIKSRALALQLYF